MEPNLPRTCARRARLGLVPTPGQFLIHGAATLEHSFRDCLNGGGSRSLIQGANDEDAVNDDDINFVPNTNAQRREKIRGEEDSG